MIDKYFGGTLPTARKADPIDNELISLAENLNKEYESHMEKYAFSHALFEIFKVSSRANKYIDETTPWLLAKEESKKPRLASVLYNLLETIRVCTVLLQPFMPDSCLKIFAQINAIGTLTEYDSTLSFGKLHVNTSVNKGDIIFPRFDTAKELAEFDK
jgi:methionyl-tRNA synthetase